MIYRSSQPRRPGLLVITITLLFFSAVVLLGGMPRASATTRFTGGEITTNTTWTRANSPYLITSPVTVSAQAVLTIEPGVEVRFSPGTSLLVAGGLQVPAMQASQVRLIGEAGQRWSGIQLAQPSANVLLKSVTVRDAETAIAISQPAANGGAQNAQVTIVDSLIAGNGVGVAADYTVNAGAPRLTLRNNLLTQNGVGFLVTNPPNGRLKPKLNHNSFVGNGIGLQAIGGTQLKAKQQWWGSALGPLTAATCTALPVPRPDPRDLICGLDNKGYTPWAKIPAGRVLVAAGASVQVESALGTGLENESEEPATSVITLTVPLGAFAEPVDLIVSGQPPAEIPTGQVGRGTPLGFEITAVAGAADLHRFANGKQLQVEIQYEPGDLAGIDPSRLGVVYYDEATKTWSRAGVRTQIDPANRRIIAQLEHLTRFSVRTVDTYSDLYIPMVGR